MKPLDLYYYGIPQRFIVGITPEELKALARTKIDRLTTALEYINDTPGVPGAKPVTQDGKATVSVGQGGLEGRVYRPTTDEQAERNLNFAIANLEAYVDWEKRGREAQAKAELEAKRAAELKAAQDRLKETQLKNGLELYNKLHSTRYLTWASLPYVPPAQREAWAKQAQELAQLQRASNPYTSSIFASGGYAAAVNRFRF